MDQQERANQGKWEFCQLRLVASAMVQDEGMRHTLDVYYTGAGGVEATQISRIGHPGEEGRVWTYNPFTAALGLLGAGGWELVSVQHGVIAESIPSHAGDIRADNVVAYLKRPVVAGRGVSEPALALS
ncbi:MAG: hypothetical protein M3014_02865 [Chloroflexota bacterium]|nr:hypothetical protein [Chloroflexota bacterium]